MFQGDFPKLLFEQVGVAMQLAYVQNFRADVELTFRYNSSPYSYGTLVVIDNHRPDTAYYRGNNYIRYHEYNHGLIKAGESGAFKMTLPWMLTNDHLVMSNPVLYPAQQMYVAVLNPLRQGLDTPNPVEVKAYARFTNIKAFGRRSVINPGPPYTITNDGYFTTGASGFYNATTGLQLQGLTLQGDIIDEAVEKSERGLISGVAEAVANVAEKAVSIPVLGSYAQATSAVARGVSTVAKALGYSKPYDLSKPVKVIQAGTTHNSSHGIDQSTRVFYRPEDHYGELVAPYKRPGQELFRDIAAIPALRHNGSLSKHQSIVLPVRPVSTRTPTLNATGGILGGRDNLLGLATYWKGAIKFKVVVTGSMLHSGRIRLAILGEDETASTEYSTFVDHEFMGSGETEIIVPYMSHKPYLGMAEASHQLEVTLAQLTHPENPAPAVYVRVTSECMEDIQFWKESYLSLDQTKTQLQGDLEQVGAKMHTSRMRLDEIVSIHDILKHNHRLTTLLVPPGARFEVDALNFDGSFYSLTWERLIRSYKYASGPLVYTFVPRDPNVSFAVYVTDNNSSAGVGTGEDFTDIYSGNDYRHEYFSRVTEASITGTGVNFSTPGYSFIGPSSVLTPRNVAGVAIPSSAAASVEFDVYVRAAEDFQLGTIIPVMDGVVEV